MMNYKTKRNLMPLIVLLGITQVNVWGQDSIKINKPKRFEYYFNGAFGLYFPFTTNTKAVANRGFVNTFQFQVNYKNNLFSRFFFDQYSVGYDENVLQNSTTLNVNQKVQTTSLGLDFGYTFDYKKFSPYAYMGAGVALMDVPTVENLPTSNTINVGTSNKNFLGLRAGIGADFNISKLFIIYAETQYLNIPFKTDLSNKNLQGLSLQIGFKTPLY